MRRRCDEAAPVPRRRQRDDRQSRSSRRRREPVTCREGPRRIGALARHRGLQGRRRSRRDARARPSLVSDAQTSSSKDVLRRRQLVEPEHRGHGVMELRRPLVKHRSKLAVREERPIHRQRIIPAEEAEIGLRESVRLHLDVLSSRAAFADQVRVTVVAPATPSTASVAGSASCRDGGSSTPRATRPTALPIAGCRP